MHIAIGILILTTLITGGLLARNVATSHIHTEDFLIDTQEVSESPVSPSPLATPEAHHDEPEHPGAVSEQTATAQPQTSPQPAPAQQDSSGALGTFRYPQSNTTSVGENHLFLSSNSSASNITEWYKRVLKEQASGSTNFVTTTVYGRAHHELAATVSGNTVRVKITQDQSGGTVLIEVTLE